MSSFPALAGSMDPRSLYDSYDTYRLADVSGPRMKHAELIQHLEKLQHEMKGVMSIEVVGRSAEGRTINLLTLGTGKKKILFWSQMHGDEPTATMALLDIVSYVGKNLGSPDVQRLLKETTLLIIPMLNPDGAEHFQRWNAQGIDINRDALRLQSPEARILKKVRDQHIPEFGFNLHDMDARLPVATTGKLAAIALLAPAIDSANTDTPVRVKAKKVAALITEVLSRYIPGHIVRYDDSYERRAFGDNIQKWGTSTVLIESGGWKDDPDKLFLRKLNYVTLLSAITAIAGKTYEKADISKYETLPESGKKIFDLIVSGVTLVSSDTLPSATVDIGFVQGRARGRSSDSRTLLQVSDVGDLSTSPTLERWNAEGKKLSMEAFRLGKNIEVDSIAKKLR
ncbi:MAG: M14 family zinc carboxypeptidase [Ignavibacteriales bacterium]|nr:M14 family zinc carboxypeptidase [Ignavibacteriales bacterium]